ncbi:hypothetical protein KTH71_07185 [Acinetobacter sp. WU_MDCI_Axc73]|nr:hypothetical protein [Acinetobacter sp. WU_MDCI_Axc73]
MQTRLLWVLLFSLGLSACDQHHSQPDIASSDPVAASSVAENSPHDDEDQGNKLVDVAGQARLPVQTAPHHQKSTLLSPEALEYTGRYHVHIPCSDPVALCKEPEGQIDYVISLLQDGTAYRQRISTGRIMIDERQNTKISQPDAWTMDSGQKEISISVFDGGNLYFKIVDSKHIKIDLDKIKNTNNGENRKNLGESFVLPQKSRILTKLPD